MSFFPSIIRYSGMYGPALALLGAVVLLLTVRGLWHALRGSRAPGSDLEAHGPDLRAQAPDLPTQANAILFWGGFSAVLGILGQCQGTYLALSAILAAPEVSPGIIAEGFVISFVPTLFGLAILGFAAVAWVCLRLQRRRR